MGHDSADDQQDVDTIPELHDEDSILQHPSASQHPSGATSHRSGKRKANSTATSGATNSSSNALSVISNRAKSSEKLQDRMEELMERRDPQENQQLQWGQWLCACSKQVPEHLWDEFQTRTFGVMREFLPYVPSTSPPFSSFRIPSSSSVTAALTTSVSTVSTISTVSSVPGGQTTTVSALGTISACSESQSQGESQSQNIIPPTQNAGTGAMVAQPPTHHYAELQNVSQAQATNPQYAELHTGSQASPFSQYAQYADASQSSQMSQCSSQPVNTLSQQAISHVQSHYGQPFNYNPSPSTYPRPNIPSPFNEGRPSTPSQFPDQRGNTPSPSPMISGLNTPQYSSADSSCVSGALNSLLSPSSLAAGMSDLNPATF